jgi:hypothetical protein
MSVESSHKFQPGRSGNPKGRPRGAKGKGTQLIEKLVSGHLQDVKDILAVTVEQAKQGEAWAVREILARLWPIPRDRATVFELREIRSQHDVVAANNDLLQAAAIGRLSPEQAGLLAQVVAQQGKALAAAELLDLAAEGKEPSHKSLLGDDE